MKSQAPFFLDEEILHGAIIFFGSWTLSVHFGVVFGLSPIFVVPFFFVLIISTFLFYLRLKFKCELNFFEVDTREQSSQQIICAFFAIIFLFLIQFSSFRDNSLLVFSFLCFFAAAAAIASVRLILILYQNRATSCIQLKGSIWVIGIAGLSALLTTTIRRPNADDSFYTSLANRVADFPFEPIQSMDTLHGLGEFALLTDSYRLHSWEALAGVLSLGSNIDPIYFLQTIFPPIAVFFVVLAAAYLLRRIEPRNYLLILFVFCLISFGFHDSHGFHRFQQGKHVMFMLMPPLIIASTMRFMESGSLKSFVILFFSTVCCIGLSASALFLVPVTTLIGLIASAWVYYQKISLKIFLKRSVFLAANLFYVVGAAVFIVVSGKDFNSYEATSLIRSFIFNFNWLDFSLVATYTDEWLKDDARKASVYASAILPIFLAWVFARTSYSKILFCSIAVIGLLVIFNPVAVALYREVPNLSSVYTRMQYALPIVLCLSFIVSEFLISVRNLDLLRLLIAFAVSVAIMIKGPMIYEENSIWDNPSIPWKIALPWETTDDESYHDAQCVVSMIGSDGIALVPHSLGVWLPQVPNHPYLVLNRYNNAQHIDRVVGSSEADWRFAMLAWIGADLERHVEFEWDSARFSGGLREFNVGSVALQLENPRYSEILSILNEEGYYNYGSCGRWIIWKRRDSAS